MSPTENRKLAVKRAVVVIGVVVFAAAAWSGFKVWSAWQNVDRVEFDPGTARDLLPEAGSSTTVLEVTTTIAASTTTAATSESTTTTIPTLFVDRGQLTTFLVTGSDDSTVRADVILVVMLPPDSGDAIILSIPRDLYVPNPCTGFSTKINENLFGCGAVSGPEQLAIAIEDFSGIPIDHFAMFTFPGFRQIIDRVGGVEVCVGEYPIRDLNRDFTDFQLPAGCSLVDGEQALSWMRSRKTQQLTGSGWYSMPGVNDLTRNERQQEMLLTALDELKKIRSLPELQGLVEDVSDTFTIDEGLGLGDAIALLWDARAISSDNIYRVALDVRHSTHEVHGAILLLNVPVSETIIDTYPGALVWLEGWDA